MKTPKLKEKRYAFTTYNALGEEVETYTVDAYSLKEAKKYATEIVGNSRDNEARHGRITLVK